MIHRHCAHCGRDLAGHRRDAVYCGRTCKSAARQMRQRRELRELRARLADPGRG